MEDTQLYASHEVIRHSCTQEQWDDLEDALKILPSKELNYLSYWMNLGVTDDSNWREYFDAVCPYEWYRFADAYHHATGRWYGPQVGSDDAATAPERISGGLLHKLFGS